MVIFEISWRDSLKGTRIPGLSAVALGSFAAGYLDDFGADMIKCEPPAGDIFRQIRSARSKTMGLTIWPSSITNGHYPRA